MRRIAVFRALQLGDLLVAVPALRVLRQRFPNAEITLIGLPWTASFVQRFACYIDRFVEFVGYPGIDEVPVDAQRTERFLAEQHAYGYDIAIQMHGSGRTSNPFVLALDAPITVGYYEEKIPAGLTIGAVYPNEQHEVYRNLNLVAMLERIVGTDSSRPRQVLIGQEDAMNRSLQLVRQDDDGYEDAMNRSLQLVRQDGDGYEDAMNRSLQAVRQDDEDAMNRSLRMDARLEFPLSARDYAEADALLHSLRQNGKPIIGIHPGARPPARRWPASLFCCCC